MRVIDFDMIAEWDPWLTEAIEEIAPPDLLSDLARMQPEYMEDARDFVVAGVGRERLVEHLVEALSDTRVRVYHGTRLDLDQLEVLRREGLKPLKLAERRSAIVRLAEKHPKWKERQEALDDALEKFGPQARAGHREDGCVHICFSRSGLLHGCNHYLTHGAEVDNHIFDALFGSSGRAYLRAGRQPLLISFEPTFKETLDAANPWGVPSDDLPSLVRLLLNSWAHRQAYPKFETAGLEDCTAARFERAILAAEITNIEFVEERMLERGKRD